MKIDKMPPAAALWAIARAARAPGAEPKKPVQAVRRIDRVRISDEGRALIAPAPNGADSAELTAEQMVEIRRRIRDGEYNSLEAVNEVARRILASGDLHRPL
jgi:ribosomal protein S12